MTVLYIILGIVAVLVVYLVTAYNGLVKLNERVKSAWSGITIQLKTRADLLPNLAEVVKGYAKHEKELLTDIAEARSSVMKAKTPAQASKAEASVQEALVKALMITENYPELKSNQNFLQLQGELSDLENKIQAARRAYNNGVTELNSKIMSFPLVLFGAFGFKSAEFFNVAEDEQKKIEKAPELKF
mgnify:CR=1 FL=1